MIFECIARSAQTVHVSLAKINSLQMDQSILPLDPRHREVPLGVPKTISKPIARSVQTMPLSCVKISTISKRTETNLYLTQVT
jgi:hypothetical protein